MPQEPQPGGRWETVRYALDSNPRTLRLCLIWCVVIVSPAVTTVITLLMRHVLLQRPRIERVFGGGHSRRARVDRPLVVLRPQDRRNAAVGLGDDP